MSFHLSTKNTIKYVCYFIIQYFISGCELDQGLPVFEADGTIGPAGGIVLINNTASSIYGARVEIPPGALTADIPVTVRHEPVPQSMPAGYHAASFGVNFGPDGTRFLKPVSITLPYHDRDNDGLIDGTAIPESRSEVRCYNETSGAWDTVTVTGRDTSRNTVTAATSHFSTYLVPVSTTAPDSTEEAETNLVPGEYFVGDQKYNIDGDGNREMVELGCLNQVPTDCIKTLSCKHCGTPYVLTVRTEVTDNGTRVIAVVDRFTTYANGFVVSLEPDGTSATIDMADNSTYFPFPKVYATGSAELWDWQCEYIAEHTNLRNYQSCADGNDLAVCSESQQKIFCDIVANGTDVTISFGIDISDIVNKWGDPIPNNEMGLTDTIAISFEANYAPE
ncbi:MAG: hypothetical protein GY868_13850 [Deltaproteobacteria bacterium]|nr:hypothetical protein [Deltaproteobacteria bacterium]